MVCAPPVDVIVNVGGGVPTPFRVVDCGDPEALSVTCKLAEKLAADEGVNVIETVQFEAAARVSPQVFVSAKSDGLLPAMVMLLIFNVALPVFDNVAVCAALVVPDREVKVSVAGVSEAIGAGAGVPAPVSVADCVVGVALSVTVSVAEKPAAEAGVKVT
jgi:hypothetical protein